MRQIGLCDLHHAARVVQAAAPSARAQLCHDLIWRAHFADKYVKRLRKIHPLWGDGSLRHAAISYEESQCIVEDTNEYLLAIARVADVLAQRRREL
ncbi:hypothetical protein [uncultured Sulfitobacter sp.]|uniref:DUF7742 family protein n=1 Tax=uncultured Sulfitobacter sp. TaxID=191468 RepID=UPI002607C50B|nr:hypothetical protein [uncultured Sulfitobacter sp.]